MYDPTRRRSGGGDGSRGDKTASAPGKTTLTSQWPSGNSVAGGPGKSTLTSQWPAQRTIDISNTPASTGSKSDSTGPEQATEPAALPAQEVPSPGAEPTGNAAPSVKPEATGGVAKGQSGSIGTISAPGLAKSAGDSDDDARSKLDGPSFGE